MPTATAATRAAARAAARAEAVDRLLRLRHVATVRRTFDRETRLQRVGFIGADELHNIGCPEFQEAEAARRWSRSAEYVVRGGPLHELLEALLDDYGQDAQVGFPRLHDCLRGELATAPRGDRLGHGQV